MYKDPQNIVRGKEKKWLSGWIRKDMFLAQSVLSFAEEEDQRFSFFSCCSCEVNLGMEKKSKKKKGGKKGARLPEDLEDDDVTVLSDSRVKVRTLAVSVPDPDPTDPHVFGPPGSGSTSQMYGSGSGSGSGSFYQHEKIVRKTLIPTIL
jgi:hypothetical protein